MPRLVFYIDNEANKTVKELMSYCDFQSEAEIFGLGLKLIGIAASIENSNGEWELIARKGKYETKIGIK